MAKLPDEIIAAIEQADIADLVPATPEQQAANAMLESEFKIAIAPELIFDGKIHRFNPDTGAASSSGVAWYVMNPADSQIPIAAGSFGNWRESDKGVNWHEDFTNTLSDAEREAQVNLLRARIDAARKIADEERAREKEQAAIIARDIWGKTRELKEGDKHPYLTAKLITGEGLHVTDGDNNLIVPMYKMQALPSPELLAANPDVVKKYKSVATDELVSLQYIYGTPGEKGKFGKRFMAGGEMGVFTFNHEKNDTSHIFICEGFATGASIHAATGCTVVVAFTAHKLPQVTAAVRTLFPKSRCLDLCVVADNDESNVGLDRANEAARQKIGGVEIARVVVPPTTGQDANDYAKANGLAALRDLLLKPEKLHRLSSLIDVQPPRWLIQDYMPRGNKNMIFGKSGCGKTFVSLNMALHIATPGMDDWFGHKVKHGSVAYLAGEDSNGVTLRAKTYCEYYMKQHPGLADPDLYISQCGFNLDKPEGLNAVVSDLAKMPQPLMLIVVDTLARNFSGNENDSQDVNKMLDNCDALQKIFKCTVCFIHHTGVSQDAQNRARGSSAWYAGLDYQLQVKAEETFGDERPRIQLINCKARNSKSQLPMLFDLMTIESQTIKNEDETPFSTLTLELNTTDKPRVRMTDATQDKFDLFCEAMDECKQEVDGTFGIRDEDLRDYVYNDYGDDATSDVKRQGFGRLKKTLSKVGKITSKKIGRSLWWFYADESDIDTEALIENERKKGML